MTFKELQGIADKEFDAVSKTLRINVADFSTANASINALFSDTLLATSISITNAIQKSITNNTIIFQGTATDIPSGLSRSQVNCLIIYSLLQDTPQLVLAFQPPPQENKFDSFFSKLKDTFFDQIQIVQAPVPLFIFSSYQHVEVGIDGRSIDLQTGLNFSGAVQPLGKAFEVVGLLFD
jgi:hypothetical protein